MRRANFTLSLNNQFYDQTSNNISVYTQDNERDSSVKKASSDVRK